MLYEVSYWAPDTHAPGWECKQRFICGSKREAELWAKEQLPTAYETEYSAKTTSRAFVKVRSCVHFRNGLMAAKEYRATSFYRDTIEQPVIIVTSVGELGYAP